MKKGVLCLLLLLLVGCAAQKADSSTEKTTHRVQSSTTQTKIRVKNETDSVAKTATTSTSHSQVSTTTTKKAETSASTTAQTPAPYAVALDQLDRVTTFHFTGVNVPTYVTIEKNSAASPTGLVTFHTEVPSASDSSVTHDEATPFTMTAQTVPTTSIRVFSAGNNAVRTVKVNTKILLQPKTITNRTRSLSDPLYLFFNKNNTLSLATPNYAGNVPTEQSDVMIEILQ